MFVLPKNNMTLYRIGVIVFFIVLDCVEQKYNKQIQFTTSKYR